MERLTFSLKIHNIRADVSVEGLNRQTAKFNFFDKDRRLADVPAYQTVVYRGVYDGIDLVMTVKDKDLEIDFIVHPGGRPEDILLAYEGIEDLRVDASGRLRIRTDFGDLWESRPHLYQEVEAKVPVAGRFVIRNSERGHPQRTHFYGFDVAAYDRDAVLVIDPVLYCASYLGGSSFDSGYGTAVDRSGSFYVAGMTYSSDFPTQIPYQGSSAGSADAFVAKFSAAGDLVYATYLGGTGNDAALFVAVDDAANIYLAGHTDSTDFPTQDPYQVANAGLNDGFIAKLTSSGDSLSFATYFGGSNSDYILSIALDRSTNMYVSGWTQSSDFPTENPYQAANAGRYDAFVAKFASSGDTLSFATYLGGSNDDYGNGIAVDDGENVYLIGDTGSQDFPTLKPYQAANAGLADAFLVKLVPNGSSLVYATYLGGSEDDFGFSLALDPAGSAHVTGVTYSDDFPTHNAYQADFLGSLNDSFVTKFTPAGNALEYSTYLGGTSDEFGNAMAVDSFGYTYVCGLTDSSDFPTETPFQDNLAGAFDAFIAKLTPSGDTLAYATYFGGAKNDNAYAIAVDTAGRVFVAGESESQDFPTENPAQEKPGGKADAFALQYQGEIGDSVVYVNKDDSTCSGYSPCRTSIEAALGNVARGGMIKVVQGSYPENMLVEQAVSFEGGADTDYGSQPGMTQTFRLTVGKGGTVIPSGLVLTGAGGH